MIENNYKIAIVGRPNVGKSRLFNRLSVKEKALWNNIAGLTRDRKETEAELGNLKFKIIDTAGFEDSHKFKNSSLKEILSEAQKQTKAGIAEANLVFFLIDIRQGVVPEDIDFARVLRKSGKKILLLANKCDAKFDEDNLNEALKLGFGEPILISAEHNMGLSEVYDYLSNEIEAEKELDEDEEEVEEEEQKENKIRIAIVGRPNAGKSTLFNAIIGEERAIVSSISGTTRDAISHDFFYEEQKISLFDTAGIRKSSKEKDDAEELAVSDAFRAIKYANIAILVIDSVLGIEKQDLTLADHIVSEGRALIIVCNKWDLIEDKKQKLEEIEYRLKTSFTQIKTIPMVQLSAIRKNNLRQLFSAILTVYENWNFQGSTSKLNEWLRMATLKNSPPSVNGRRIKFKFVKQTGHRPPAITINTTSNLKGLSGSYIKYLVNHFTEHFNLSGTPIRVHIFKPKNPFLEDSEEMNIEV